MMKPDLKQFLQAHAKAGHLWSGKEIAALLEIHPRTWRKWHREARVPATIPVNHAARWSVQAVALVCQRIAARPPAKSTPRPPTPYPRPRPVRGNVPSRYD